jgi:hypothetical protein
MTDLDIIEGEWVEVVEVQEHDYSWFDDPEYQYLKRNFKAMRSRERNIHSFELGWDPRDDMPYDAEGATEPRSWFGIVCAVLLVLAIAVGGWLAW